MQRPLRGLVRSAHSWMRPVHLPSTCRPAAEAVAVNLCLPLEQVDGLFRFGQQLFAQHAEAWRPAAATLKAGRPNSTRIYLISLACPGVSAEGAFVCLSWCFLQRTATTNLMRRVHASPKVNA